MSSETCTQARNGLGAWHQYGRIRVSLGVARGSQRIPAGVPLAICIEAADHLVQEARAVGCRQLKHLLCEHFYG
jgi:hypothetical protein